MSQSSAEQDRVTLRQMFEHAKEAVALAGNRDRQDLESNRVIGLAVVRILEIIGEAARRISPETTATHPQVPWAQLIGLRNRLIHGYDSVDMGIVWQILREDLPRLIEDLRAIPGVEDDIRP